MSDFIPCPWCGRPMHWTFSFCSERCALESRRADHEREERRRSLYAAAMTAQADQEAAAARRAVRSRSGKDDDAELTDQAVVWIDWLVRLSESPPLSIDSAPPRATVGYRFSVVVPDVKLPFADFRQFNGLGSAADFPPTGRWGSSLPASVYRFAGWLARTGVPFARTQVVEKGSGWFAKDTARPGGIDWCLAGTADAGGKSFQLFRLQLRFRVAAVYGRDRDEAEAEALLAWFDRYKKVLPAAWAMSEFAKALEQNWVDEDEVSWNLIRREFTARTGKELPESGWKLPPPAEAVKTAPPKRPAETAAKATEPIADWCRALFSSPSVPGDAPTKTTSSARAAAATPASPAPPGEPPVESGGLWARPGRASEIALKGCSWASKGGWTTIEAKAAAVRNESPWDTGSLKIIFWLCREPFVKGTGLGDDAVHMGEAWATKPPLAQGAKLEDVSVSMRRTGNPPTGEYRAVLTVNERNDDGSNYIVGWCNFPNPVRWTHR